MMQKIPIKDHILYYYFIFFESLLWHKYVQGNIQEMQFHK